MSPLHWSLLTGALLLFAVVLSSRAARARQGRRHGAWTKALAALRAVLSAALALVMFQALVSATAGAADAVRWAASVAAGVALLVIVLNALAGLWLLSPLVGADLGADISAGGTKGTLRGYGWLSLQLTTRAGWTAHLLYLSVALRPLVVHRQDGPQLVELELPLGRWSDGELSHAHQLAVLSPYRDPTSPVRLSRRGRVATLRFALARRASPERAQRHLELALGLSGPRTSRRA